MVHVDNGIHAARSNHINNIRDTLEPFRIDSPVRCLRREVVRPCHWYANALEARSFGVVKSTAYNRGVVPVSLVLHSIKRVADVPAWIEFGEESSSGEGVKFRV